MGKEKKNQTPKNPGHLTLCLHLHTLKRVRTRTHTHTPYTWRCLSIYVQLRKNAETCWPTKMPSPHVAKSSLRRSRIASCSPIAAVTTWKLQVSVLIYTHKNKINIQTKYMKHLMLQGRLQNILMGVSFLLFSFLRAVLFLSELKSLRLEKKSQIL